MMTDTTPKSRTEALARIAREYGTDFLLDVISESRVGVTNAFSNEADMDTVIQTAKEMLADRGEE